MTEAVERVLRLLAEQGAAAYLGEPVSMAEHMLQTAALAEADGADSALIAAALLHDIGHFADDSAEAAMAAGVDRHHEAAGAAMLAAFPPVVAACARLHVAAKRYLCRVDPAYRAQLSAASERTLAIQGGPMSDAEALGFRAEPFHLEAVRVRRWDDAAKIAGRATRTAWAYAALLEQLVGVDHAARVASATPASATPASATPASTASSSAVSRDAVAKV